jgi:hypothetical protein
MVGNKMIKSCTLGVLCIVVGPPATAQDFSDYPVEIWQGAPKRPNFNGAQKDYAFFRTRLGNAAERDADFAGSWVVEQIGCGSGCTSTYTIDRKTGNITGLPIGGEEQMYVSVQHRVDSALIKATWIENGYGPNGDCIEGRWVMDGLQVVEVGTRREVPVSFCGFLYTSP